MNKLQALRCIEVTSQRQANNGTICYHDPITNCDYILYESGYVRRKYSTRNHYYGVIFNTIYQLNPTRVIKEKRFNTWQGGYYEIDRTVRILLNTPEERMECAARAVVNYRNTLKKYKNA